MSEDDIINRWRLILGKNSEQNLNFSKDEYYQIEDTLEYLYNRYDNSLGEGEGEGDIDTNDSRKGGTTRSGLTVVDWVDNVRTLFPKDVSQKIEKHALEEFELTELLTDETVLKSLKPNRELLKNILAFKNLFDPKTMKTVRTIIKKIAEDLEKVLEVEVKKSFSGISNKNQRSNFKIYRNFDVKYTIKKNLKNFDKTNRKLIIDKPYFNSNFTKQNKYKVIMVIDESGSMLDSVINSAILAGIFAKMPSLELNLLIFDTEVVDLSDKLDDPVETLLSIQLGGGTDIGHALDYSSQLIENPQKTILILVTDLFEGGSEKRLLNVMKNIVETGTKFLILTAIDDNSNSVYDHTLAQKAVNLGANVATMTPNNLSDYIADIIR